MTVLIIVVQASSLPVLADIKAGWNKNSVLSHHFPDSANDTTPLRHPGTYRIRLEAIAYFHG